MQKRAYVAKSYVLAQILVQGEQELRVEYENAKTDSAKNKVIDRYSKKIGAALIDVICTTTRAKPKENLSYEDRRDECLELEHSFDGAKEAFDGHMTLMEGAFIAKFVYEKTKEKGFDILDRYFNGFINQSLLIGVSVLMGGYTKFNGFPKSPLRMEYHPDTDKDDREIQSHANLFLRDDYIEKFFAFPSIGRVWGEDTEKGQHALKIHSYLKKYLNTI